VEELIRMGDIASVEELCLDRRHHGGRSGGDGDGREERALARASRMTSVTPAKLAGEDTHGVVG
jgi:hypothetical protein